MLKKVFFIITMTIALIGTSPALILANLWFAVETVYLKIRKEATVKERFSDFKDIYENFLDELVEMYREI